jgi:hypothetical protein
MIDDLIYRKNPSIKAFGIARRITSCVDSIAAIDIELQAEHALNEVDPVGSLLPSKPI